MNFLQSTVFFRYSIQKRGKADKIFDLDKFGMEVAHTLT